MLVADFLFGVYVTETGYKLEPSYTLLLTLFIITPLLVI